MKTEESYLTSDTDLATTLVTLGHIVLKVDKTDPKRVVFTFARGSQLLKDVTDYQGDTLLLQPQRLFSSYKYIKSLIYSQ